MGKSHCMCACVCECVWQACKACCVRKLVSYTDYKDSSASCAKAKVHAPKQSAPTADTARAPISKEG